MTTLHKEHRRMIGKSLHSVRVLITCIHFHTGAVTHSQNPCMCKCCRLPFLLFRPLFILSLCLFFDNCSLFLTPSPSLRLLITSSCLPPLYLTATIALFFFLLFLFFSLLMALNHFSAALLLPWSITFFSCLLVSHNNEFLHSSVVRYVPLRHMCYLSMLLHLIL